MVDFDMVLDKLKRGAYVGLGASVAKILEPNVEEFVKGLPGENAATLTNAGLILGGAGVSVAADELISNRGSIPNNIVEFAGYGVQSVGYSQAASDFTGGFQTKGLSTSGKVIEVSSGANASKQQTGQTTDENRVDRGSFQLNK